MRTVAHADCLGLLVHAVCWACVCVCVSPQVLSGDSAFIRVTKGLYTLRCWASELPPQQDQGAGAGASGGAKVRPCACLCVRGLSARQQAGTQAPVLLACVRRAAQHDSICSGLTDAHRYVRRHQACRGLSGGLTYCLGCVHGCSLQDAPAASGKSASEAGEQQQGLARAEAVLGQAQRAVAARRRDADAAAQALDACQSRLAEAKEAEKAKAKQGPAQSAGSSNGALANGAAAGASPSKEDLDAKFALPGHLKEYTGVCSVTLPTAGDSSSSSSIEGQGSLLLCSRRCCWTSSCVL